MATSSTEVPQPSKAPKSRKLIFVIAVIVLILAACGGAAYYFLAGHGVQAEKAALPADPIFIALEPFTVNLQPGGRSRFLHVGVTLKVADAASQEQVNKYLPEVRSRILSVLSNRDAEGLITPEQKTKLSGELLEALRLPFIPNLAPAKISSLMFTAFIVQ